MHISIDELAQRNRSIEDDLRLFGLTNIDKNISEDKNNCDWYHYSSEMRLSEVKVDVNRLQNHNKKLTEEIRRSQKAIKALKECLATKVNESEINKVSAKRNAIIQKLESKQKEIDNHLLSLIKKIEELG